MEKRQQLISNQTVLRESIDTLNYVFIHAQYSVISISCFVPHFFFEVAGEAIRSDYDMCIRQSSSSLWMEV